jgi:hypothetical protein
MANPYMINYNPISAPDSIQQLATHGLGQTTLRDLLFANSRGLAQQYGSGFNQINTAFANRGLLDSSIAQNRQAQLAGNVAMQFQGINNNVNDLNRQEMLRAQQLLEQVRQFNARNSFEADMFNRNKEFEMQRYLHQLNEANQNKKRGFFSGLASLGGAIMGLGGVGTPIGAGMTLLGLLGGSK